MNRLPTVAALTLLAAAAAATACGSDETSTGATAATSAAQSSAVIEDYPVEALPDPLPAPYLFREELTIEETPVTETIYVVQPGDTLASIAERFCLTLEEIQRLNNIVDVSTLSIGQELRIPIHEGGCGIAAPSNATASDDVDEPTQLPGEIYVVEGGDTLAEIAAAFGFTWIDLMNYNGLTEAQAGNLQVGQTLIIPPQPDSDEQQAAQPESAEPPG